MSSKPRSSRLAMLFGGFLVFAIIVSSGVSLWRFLRQWYPLATVLAAVAGCSIAAVLAAFALLLKALKRRERDMAVTERLKTEAEAASRAKSEFLGMMSHEILTPLTSIIGFADLLETEGAPRDIGMSAEQLAGLFQSFSQAGSANAPSGLAPLRQLSGHLLLAEDGADNRTLICAFLARLGLEYDVVENGAQAVERALAVSYDAILMDVQMPVLDGIAATRTLRAAGFAAPIVALTANLMAEDVQRYLDAGCSRCVGKPIDFAGLAQCLAELLQQQGAGPAQPFELAALAGFADIKRAFEQSLPPRLAQLLDLVDAADWDGAAALVHTLKGAAGSFGYPRVTAQSQQIEQALRQGDVATAAALARALPGLVEAQLAEAKLSQQSPQQREAP